MIYPSSSPTVSATVQEDIANRTTTLHTILRMWLILGSAAIALFPSLRASNPQFGWLPFWLVVAPMIDLIALNGRRWKLAMLRELRTAKRRRHRLVPCQASLLRVKTIRGDQPARASRMMSSRPWPAAKIQSA